MEQKKQSENDEMWMLMRQNGFGAVLGIAFLSVLYIGGLLARLASWL